MRRQAMGKTAALAADLLRASSRRLIAPSSTWATSSSSFIAAQAVLTGMKLEQKYYRTHSGYPGGFTRCSKEADGGKARAGHGACREGHAADEPTAMWQLRRLKVFRDASHKHRPRSPLTERLEGGRTIWQRITARDDMYGTGRRKSSIARVHLFPAAGQDHVNGRDIDDIKGWRP
jgi:large subunit ribosomal protein L13